MAMPWIKTTCKELNGWCDEELQAQTGEDMVYAMKQHLEGAHAYEWSKMTSRDVETMESMANALFGSEETAEEAA